MHGKIVAAQGPATTVRFKKRSALFENSGCDTGRAG